jgi:hypothetical protein
MPTGSDCFEPAHFCSQATQWRQVVAAGLLHSSRSPYRVAESGSFCCNKPLLWMNLQKGNALAANCSSLIDFHHFRWVS